MTDNAPVEVVLTNFMKVKDGTKMSLVLHPNDVPDWLQLAPLGQRMAMALVPIKAEEAEHGQGHRMQTAEEVARDIVQRNSGSEPRGSNTPATDPEPAPSNNPSEDGAGTRPKQVWGALPASRQAGIRCRDMDFQKWVWARYRDQNIPPTVVAQGPDAIAAHLVRTNCGVTSRGQLDTEEQPGKRWAMLDMLFRESMGQENG